MSNERNYGIFGFLAGAAVGATLGILFAPRSGKETRAILSNKAHSAKDGLDELLEKGREEWSKAKGKATDAATMTKEEVNDFIRFLFEEGRDLKDRLAKDVEEAADETTSKARKAAEHVRRSAN